MIWQQHLFGQKNLLTCKQTAGGHAKNEEKFIAAFGSGYIEEFMKDGSKVLSLDPGGLIYQVMKTVDY